MSTVQTKTECTKVAIEKPAQPVASPRKRRRRAPAAGAAVDCFACQERQTKCDRRRPYCTPCLDQGKDCSGYKTTLTWGIGVASRGKLRGLSLPVASSKRAAPHDEKDEKSSTGPRKTNKPSPKNAALAPSDNSKTRSSPPMTTRTHDHMNSVTYDFVNMDANATTSPMLPPPSIDWRATTSLSQARGLRLNHKNKRRHTLQPVSVPTSHPSRDYGVMPMTASIVGGYGNQSHGLSSQISPIMPTFTGYGIISPSYPDFNQHAMTDSSGVNSFYPDSESLGWARDDLSSSLSSDGSQGYAAEDQVFFNDMDNIFTSSQSYASSMVPAISTTECQSQMVDDVFTDFKPDHPLSICALDAQDRQAEKIPRSLPTLPIGNTPRLQFLINYYDKVISPVIVAFDGPTNPYRQHILSLALESEPLQHAIAALAAGNIRMRRVHNPHSITRSTTSVADSSHDHSVRRSSFAHSLMDVEMNELPQTSSNEASGDELYYKGASIKALNEQLADPNRRKNDSILATLLILCLYHICDTGVAKFKTQFAGVKKILALRGGTKGTNSKASNWLTIMFTWFDAMTATVNDREGVFDGDEFDSSKLNANEWALENLAGCDGRLFKIIAKLGRLNMLSQNKPVADTSPRTSPKAQSPTPAKSQDFYSMNYKAFDGNGWSAMTMEESDARSQFWKEWSETHQKLKDWHLDDSPRSTPVDSTSPECDRRDIYHISESFRYSALLYTERLAYPHLSSSHPNFQNLVTQALHHISHVKSDVFLLWPLFITGTECVSEQGRYLIRQRCQDIQKDSGFFNNISGLELLERVWRDDLVESGVTSDHLVAPTTGIGPADIAAMTSGGFKWRKAMERTDGEYIVV